MDSLDSAQRKLLKQTKFPANFNTKVDVRKVEMGILKNWIKEQITQILQTDDEVTVDWACELVDDKSHFPDIKSIQIMLTPTLDKHVVGFCKELWDMMLSAQESENGVPAKLLEAKKRELLEAKANADRIANEKMLRDAEEDRKRDRPDHHNNKGGRGQYGQSNRSDRGRDRGFNDRRRSSFDRSRRNSQDYGRRDHGRHDRYRDRSRSQDRRRSPEPRHRSPRPTRPTRSDRDRYRSRSRSRSPYRPSKEEARAHNPPSQKRRKEEDTEEDPTKKADKFLDDVAMHIEGG